MPKHPDTGEEISRPVYDAIVAEREKQYQIEARIRAEVVEQMRNDATKSPEIRYPAAEAAAAARAAAPPGPDLKGCALVVLAGIAVISFAAFAGSMAWNAFRPATPVAPVVPSPVIPSPSFDAAVAPLKLKLAYDPAKAREVQKNYAGIADAIAGASGARVKDTRILESVMQAYLTDLNDMGGTPVGLEIDTAVGQALGLDRSADPKDPGWSFKVLDMSDRAKLVAIFRAIASAAESVQ